MSNIKFAYKCTLFVGLFDKDTKQQEICTECAEQLIANYFARHNRCVTLSRCTGVYRHDDGTTVVEPSIKIEWYLTADDFRAEMLDASDYCPVGVISVLSLYLNQESVAWETLSLATSGVYYPQH